MLEVLFAVAVTASPEAIRFPQAVDRALRSNPALRIAADDVARAYAVVEQQRSASLPTLYAAGVYTQLDAPRVESGVLLAGQRQLSLDATLTVPLQANRWAQWWRADKAATAQKATSDDVRRQVALLAARSWLNVLAQKRVLEASTLARDTAKAHLDFATQRRQGGVGNRLDEIRAAQELAVSQSQLESAAAGVVRAQEALGVAVGGDLALDAVTEEPDLAKPNTLDDAMNGVPDRTDVKAAEVRKETAIDSTHADWADYLPLLTLVGQPFYQSPPTPTVPQTGWQAQAILTLPIYDGGLRYGQAKERRAIARQADADMEATLRQAKSEVRAAFDSLSHTDDALKAARDSATEAKEALELATIGYTTGVGTNLDVIDAERRYRDAETSAAVAEDASRQARLDLLAAAGRFP